MAYLSFSSATQHLTVNLGTDGDERTLIDQFEALRKDATRLHSLHITGSQRASEDVRHLCIEQLERILDGSKVELLVGPQSSSEAATSDEDIAMAKALLASGAVDAVRIKSTDASSVMALAVVAVDGSHPVHSFAWDLSDDSFLHEDLPNPTVMTLVETLARSTRLQHLVIEAGHCWDDECEELFEILLGTQDLAAVLHALGPESSLHHLGWRGHQLDGYKDLEVCQRLFSQPLRSLDLSGTTCHIPPERMGSLVVHPKLERLGLDEALRSTVMQPSDAEHVARWAVAQCQRSPKLHISLQNNLKKSWWQHAAVHTTGLASVCERLEGCPKLTPPHPLATPSALLAPPVLLPCSSSPKQKQEQAPARRVVPPSS